MNEESALHSGHRERIRERFRTEGLSGFSEHEVLELLLTYAIPQRDVNPLAHHLIDTFGSLANVLDADIDELTRVAGVGTNTATMLTLVPQLLSFYQISALGKRPVIRNFEQARSYCGALFMGARCERVYMICLDQSGRVIHPVLLHEGTLDEVSLYPREIVRIALRHNSYGVLLAHNHPGGDAGPSQADYDTTRAIVSALLSVQVRVIDHLIFTKDVVYSMTRASQISGDGGGFSYMMRSSDVSLSRGSLRTQDEDDWISLTFDGGKGAP